jgi:seryl-tRNA synthetase
MPREPRFPREHDMIDIRLIRENPDLVKRAVRDKGLTCDVDRLLEVDARRRALETEYNELRARQNRAGERFARASDQEKAALRSELGALKARLGEIDHQRAAVEAELGPLMLLVPQIPAYDEGVPIGASPAENVEVRRVGTPKRKGDFGFPFRDHVELGARLGIIDIERGVKLAGSRNYVLKGAGALLHEAVLRLAWDMMLGRSFQCSVFRVQGSEGPPQEPAGPNDPGPGGRLDARGASKREPEPRTPPPEPSDRPGAAGLQLKPEPRTLNPVHFVPMTVPVLVLDRIMEGTGYFPLGRDQAYLCERDGQSLVGTAEVPVTGYHMDEILREEELPRLYLARSTCFRREAGAAGKDTHGLYRIHFFDKIEQVVICRADPRESAYWHEVIIRNATDVLEALELPYRLVEVCTGDMGQGKVRMFDIETWMPGRDAWGETHSASRFHDFQARRLNLRYRDAGGKLHFCHTLNNTVIASPRILIPILELNQNADGSVTVPRPLRSYMGGMERIG